MATAIVHGAGTGRWSARTFEIAEAQNQKTSTYGAGHRYFPIPRLRGISRSDTRLDKAIGAGAPLRGGACHHANRVSVCTNQPPEPSYRIAAASCAGLVDKATTSLSSNSLIVWGIVLLVIASERNSSL